MDLSIVTLPTTKVQDPSRESFEQLPHPTSGATTSLPDLQALAALVTELGTFLAAELLDFIDLYLSKHFEENVQCDPNLVYTAILEGQKIALDAVQDVSALEGEGLVAGNTFHRVLDVGTGTDIWAFDFADEHPEAQAIGVDLSPIQPKFVPLDDLEEDAIFKLIEDGQPDAIALRKRLRDISVEYFAAAYNQLNIKFDEYASEFEVSCSLEAIVEAVKGRPSAYTGYQRKTSLFRFTRSQTLLSEPPLFNSKTSLLPFKFEHLLLSDWTLKSEIRVLEDLRSHRAESSSLIPARLDGLERYTRLLDWLIEPTGHNEGDYQNDSTGTKHSSYDDMFKKHYEPWWVGLRNQFLDAAGWMGRKYSFAPFNREDTGTWKPSQSPFGSNLVVEVDYRKEVHSRNSIYGQSDWEESWCQTIWEMAPGKRRFVHIWHCCACGNSAMNIIANMVGKDGVLKTVDWVLRSTAAILG